MRNCPHRAATGSRQEAGKEGRDPAVHGWAARGFLRMRSRIRSRLGTNIRRRFQSREVTGPRQSRASPSIRKRAVRSARKTLRRQAASWWCNILQEFPVHGWSRLRGSRHRRTLLSSSGEGHEGISAQPIRLRSMRRFPRRPRPGFAPEGIQELRPTFGEPILDAACWRLEISRPYRAGQARLAAILRRRIAFSRGAPPSWARADLGLAEQYRDRCRAGRKPCSAQNTASSRIQR